MADILKRLSQEHDEVTQLLDALNKGEGDRSSLFERSARVLRDHSKAEHELYVHGLDHQIESKVGEALQELQEVEKLLNRMQAALGHDEKFASLLEDLTDRVAHHIDEEEWELFPLMEELMAANG